MKRLLPALGVALVLAAKSAVAGTAPTAPAAAPATTATPASDQPLAIDLESALRLAGADNLDVRIAGEKLAGSEASRIIALEEFFPSIAGGIAYRRHHGAIQNVQGDIEQVHKESYAPGALVTLEADIGEAIFHSLEARQLVKAAGHNLDAERQRAIAAAAAAYFELVRAGASVRAAKEAADVSATYSDELDSAVKIGIALEGDRLQAAARADEDRLALRHAEETRRVAALKLAGILDLDPAVNLAPRDDSPVVMNLFAVPAPVSDQVAEALARRPELQRSLAERDAARDAERGTKYGPLAPSLNGQVFAGGTGGHRDGSPDRFDDTEDYVVGLQWKLGPGGLFDVGRIEKSAARHREADLDVERTRKRIAEEVLVARERVDSLAAQVVLAERTLASSRDAFDLKRRRKDFGVAAVLETIQAERDWIRALDAWLATITDYDAAQYELLRATGALGDTVAASAAR